MLKRMASKVAWVGRTASMVFGLALVLALVFGALSVAVAHSGSAGLFHLNHNNPVSALSSLTGNVANRLLNITNQSTANTATAVGATNKSPVSPAIRATNSGGGPALDLRVGNTVVPANNVAPMKVNSDKLVTNLNSDRLDGLNAAELGEITQTNHQRTDTCDTPNTWNQCATLAVTVPAGKAYIVTVWSSLSATGNPTTNTTLFYCPGIVGGSFSSFTCLTPASDYIEIPAGVAESAAISQQAILTAGSTTAVTYFISTGVHPDLALTDDANQNAHTTVMVEDNAAPGPPISGGSSGTSGASSSGGST